MHAIKSGKVIQRFVCSENDSQYCRNLNLRNSYAYHVAIKIVDEMFILGIISWT